MDAAGLRRMFAHDAWANREACLSVAAGSGAKRASELLAHIAGAEWLWWSRIRGAPSPIAVWPSLEPAQCRERLDAVAAEWAAYLEGLDPAELARRVDYVNSRGEPWTSAVSDILVHVVLHSSHHRGQIALVLREDAHQPAQTDYIHCVRQGLLS